MATIAEILHYKWPGAEWAIDEDDYTTLLWLSTDIPKPTFAEIRQHNGEVQQLIAVDRKAERQRDKLLERPESMVEIVDVLVDVVKQINDSIKPASLSKPIDSTRLNALFDKVQVVKNTE